MSNGSISRYGSCSSPALNRRLAAYCFEDVAEDERESIHAHLLDCDPCWEEAKRLMEAVEALRAEKAVAGSLSAQEMASLFGISGKIDWPLGGHRTYVLLSSGLYAMAYFFILLSEVSYAFDRLGLVAMILAPLVFCWVFSTSIAALFVDWKGAMNGKAHGLPVSIGIVIASAFALFGALCLFLPDVPITVLTKPAQTARGAYLKGMGYILPIAIFYQLMPFHFTVAMQRELRDGRHRMALAFLTGDKRAVAPAGAVYISFRSLAALLAIAFLASVRMNLSLFSETTPSPYLGLFTIFVYLRWFAYFGFGLVCLLWYNRQLNELKRECLAAENISF